MKYTNIFDAKGDRLVQRLSKLAFEGKYFDLKREINHAVLEIIAEVINISNFY